MREMTAVCLTGPRSIELRRVEVPSPPPGKVLVRVRAVGVCGSDVHYYQHGRMGPFAPTEPLVLGHESAGQIMECGVGVTGLRVGDRVALEPGIPCGGCEMCKRGRYNLCPSVYFMGSAPNQHGAFREYLVWDPRMCYHLPSAVSFEEGALLEPLAAACYAVRLGAVGPGQTVAVFGCGPIGLLIARMAKVCGAAEVLVTDLEPHRLKRAQSFGATRAGALEDLVSAVQEATGGQGADVVFEAAGSPASHQKSLEIAARGGTVVFVGWLADGNLNLDLHQIGTRELTVRGMFRYRNVYPEALRLVSQGMVDLRSLITSRYSLSDVEAALREALSRGPDTLKVMVRVGDDA